MYLEIFLCSLVIIFLYKISSEKNNLPPGPWHIPFFGRLIPRNDKEARKYAQQFGDIFTIKTGVIPFTFLSDFKLAKEVFSMPEATNRPDWRAFATLRNNKLEKDFSGLVGSRDLRWQHNRRFTLRHLRDLGMGKSRLEDSILFEISEVVKYFKTLEEEPTEIPFVLNIAILNVIWQLVASHRYEFGDKQVEKFMKTTNETQTGFFNQAFVELFPILNYLPKRLLDSIFRFDRLTKLRQDFNSFIMPFIEEHLKSLDVDNPKDYIDEYLISMEEQKGNPDSFFDFDDLRAGLFDLFIAGNDTVAYSTKWLILHMAKNPEIQKKAQEEIDKVVARDTLPTLEHRASLPYVDALINEVLRVSSFLNFGVSRMITKDITIRGYTIPKDSVILTLADISHEDPKYWKNPEILDPERFLDSNGKLRINHDGHQPFGFGRRQCLGEPLARMELYLMAASLLQNFSFLPSPGTEVDVTPMDFPFFHWPKKQKIIIKKRE